MSKATQTNRGRHPCPDCGSEHGLAHYENATHCFSCGAHHILDGKNPSYSSSDNNINNKIEDIMDLKKLKARPIADRNISQDVCAFYKTATLLDEATGQPKAIYAPLYARGRNPERLGFSIRTLPKQFTYEPAGQKINLRCGLFGQQLFEKGSSRYITVTEGVLDALAGYQMFGSKYPFVSVINGADSAPDEFRRNLEYLESFEKVYIAFDRDEPGQKAAVACAKLLSPGKAYIVALDPKLKDACGYLKENKVKEFVSAWWNNSSLYTPQNILSSSQLKNRIRNRKEVPSVPYPFDGLNALTYGIRKKEAVVFTAQTGIGKTTVLREIMWNILKEDKDAKIGTMFLEEDPTDTGIGLMSMKASIPFHLPDAEYTKEQFDEAEKVLDEDRVFFFDHFGSNSIDEIISRVRYYAKGLGCQYIFLDHLSIIVSDQQQGDERKALDEIMTKLKTITMELDIALIAVVHVNRNGQIRGTAGIEQMANVVVHLERDVTSEDPAVRRTLNGIVAKNRFSGKTGPAFHAAYNETTGRLDDLDREQAQPELTDKELTNLFDGGTLSSDGEEEPVLDE